MKISQLLSLTFLLGLVTVSATFAQSPDRELPASFNKAAAPLNDIAQHQTGGLDNDLLEAVYADTGKGSALRFAEPVDVFLSPNNAGTWENLSDGSRLWRLAIDSAGARNLSIALRRFEMPAGAKLWIYDRDQSLIQGPYTAADRTPEGELWPAMVDGQELIVEVYVPAGAADPDLVIHRVHHGFKSFGPTSDNDGFADKQGNCQNDVVCSEADPWRRQIRAVAWYSIQGEGVCTGTLMNNTRRDDKPLFLSADHCGITRNNVSSMVVYWNYESPTCGRLAGGSRSDNQSGAKFLSSYGPSDFVLVELNQKPRTSSRVYYSGWNAVNQAPRRAVGIHHPNLDEKSISFNNQRLTTDGNTHWEIVWNDGTTEPGSSGSCIFDPDGYCVGTLTSGESYCWNPQGPDQYGRMSVHWNGGGAKANSLRQWLDPAGTGQKKLAGKEPGGGGNGGGGGGNGGGNGGGGNGGGGTCTSNSKTLCLADGRFKVTATYKRSGSFVAATVRQRGNESGVFSFAQAATWMLMTSVTDRCSDKGRFDVRAAASTSVAHKIRVEDTATGRVKTYSHGNGGKPKAIIDTATFKSCP